MLSGSPLVCCSGRFPFIGFYDQSLSGRLFEIPFSSSHARAPQLELCRVVHLPSSDSSSTQSPPPEVHPDFHFSSSSAHVNVASSRNDTDHLSVAASGWSKPYAVYYCDLGTRSVLSTMLGHRRRVFGLAAICPNSLICENPRLVTGASGDSQLFVFDAVRGLHLLSLSEAPHSTYRIRHVPEWTQRDVFTAGYQGIRRYDLESGKLISSCNPGRNTQLYAMEPAVGQKFVFTGGVGKRVTAWSSDLATRVRFGFNTLKAIESLCYVEEHSLLVVGLKTGLVEVWDPRHTRNRVRLVVVATPRRPVSDICPLNRADLTFVSGSRDKCLTTWSARSGCGVAKRTPLPGNVLGVACIASSDRVDRVLFGGELEMMVEKSRFLFGEFGWAFQTIIELSGSLLHVSRAMLMEVS